MITRIGIKMSDLFDNTEYQDTRPAAVKEFNDLQQARDEQRKNNKMDMSGLPLFSEEERASRATVQETLL